MAETYQGWPNRETWAMALWLTNDQVMYLAARECVDGRDLRDAADALREWVEHELWDSLWDTSEGRAMLEDVGSVWRVEWDHVAAALQEA